MANLYDWTNQKAQSGQRTGQLLYGSMLPGLFGGVDDAVGFNTGLRNSIANMYMSPRNGNALKNVDGTRALPKSNMNPFAQGQLQRMAVGGGDIPFAQDSVDMFSNWRDTGGITANDERDMRRASTSVIPSFFRGMQSDMDRMRRVQGGYSGGYTAQNAALARDSARAAANADVDAEGKLAQMRVAGKQFGTQGLENFFGRYGDTYNQNQRFGLGMLNDQDRWERESQMRLNSEDTQNDFAAANGLLGLYGTSPAGTNSAYNNLFQGLSGRDSSNMGYLSLLSGMNQKPLSTWEKIMKGVGMGAGVMGAFI